jgi:hypothetical protein
MTSFYRPRSACPRWSRREADLRDVGWPRDADAAIIYDVLVDRAVPLESSASAVARGEGTS